MKESKKQKMREQIESLSPRERMEIIGDFCSKCGYKNESMYECTCRHGEEE